MSPEPKPSEKPPVEHAEEIQYLSEVTKNGRRIFTFLLLGCFYSLLTILTTSDSELITNTTLLPLPLIGGQMEVIRFYIAAPLLLLSFYLYFHLYLMRLWRGIVRLPHHHADGRPVDDYVYPWIISNAMVRARLGFLKGTRRPFSYLESSLSIFLAWWSVPLTIMFFWARFLTRHDPWATAYHSILLATSVTVAIRLYRMAMACLQKKPPSTGPSQGPMTWRRFLRLATVFLSVLVPVGYLSLGAIGGAPQRHCDASSDDKVECSILYSGVRVFDILRVAPFARLEKVQVSTRTSNWTGAPEELERELRGIEGAFLQGVDLRHADAKRSFLVAADLVGADMRWANLQRAQLQGAFLQRAFLQHAILDYASLQQADLKHADLRDASFFRASLAEARLDGANLRDARMMNVNLEDALGPGADFTGARLQFAKMARADFDGASFDSAFMAKADMRGVSLESQASLRGANLTAANLGPFVGKLERMEAVLSNADLEGAILNSARLPEADLYQAILKGAHLEKAVMTGVDATSAQLQDAVLTGAEMEGANFLKADLRRAKLDVTNLQDALFPKAFLVEADLSGASASGADFRQADLTRAVLHGINLTDARLFGAILKGADMTGAFGLTQAQLDGACGDEHTQLPAKLTIEPCGDTPVREAHARKQ